MLDGLTLGCHKFANYTNILSGEFEMKITRQGFMSWNNNTDGL